MWNSKMINTYVLLWTLICYVLSRATGISEISLSHFKYYRFLLSIWFDIYFLKIIYVRLYFKNSNKFSYLYTNTTVNNAFAVSIRYALKLQLELVQQYNDMHQSGK